MDFDIAIIGGGPSGALSALILARAGKRVVLLDRSSFPRPKVCGDCINPSSDAIWSRLGLKESYEKLPYHQVTGLSVECENEVVLTHSFGDRTKGSRVIARSVLDDWLVRQAEQAGVKLMLDTTLKSVDCETGRVQTTQGDIFAQNLLGADGRNSFSAREAGLSAPAKRCHRIAWQATLDLKHDLAAYPLDDLIHLHIFPEGYYGLVRINEEQANLCFVLDCRRANRIEPIAERYFPAIRAQAWRTVNPISRAHAQLGKGRLWLIGDAARVVEPFTGEGIYFALATAELASNSLLAGASLATYERQHSQLYRSRIWANDLIRIALLKPKRALFFGRIFRHLPSVTRFVSEKIHQSDAMPLPATVSK